jgi:hypothetical protein
MEFYEVQFDDRYGKTTITTIPYSEIIGWEKLSYDCISTVFYTPITRTKIPDLHSLLDDKGELEFLKWKDFLSRTK